jgi:hypothetical protein
MFDDKKTCVISFKATPKERDILEQEARSLGYIPKKSIKKNRVNIGSFVRDVVLKRANNLQDGKEIKIEGVAKLTASFLEVRPVIAYMSSVYNILKNRMVEQTRETSLGEYDMRYLGKLEEICSTVLSNQDKILKNQQRLAKELEELKEKHGILC